MRRPVLVIGHLDDSSVDSPKSRCYFPDAFKTHTWSGPRYAPSRSRGTVPCHEELLTMGDLGTKHECSACGAKFYDLGKPDPVCPKCGADMEGRTPEEIERKLAEEAAEEAELEEDELDEDEDEDVDEDDDVDDDLDDLADDDFEDLEEDEDDDEDDDI
jgi:hypothetical protein